MQAQVNRTITLNGITYGRGQHAIPATDAQGWFFDALVQSGDVVVLRADETVQEEEADKPARKSKKAD
jgi:hypothetical protein